MWNSIKAQVSVSLSPIQDVSICGGTPLSNLVRTTCVMEGDTSALWPPQTRSMRHENVLPSGRSNDVVREEGVTIGSFRILKYTDPFMTELWYYPHNFSLPTTISCQPVSSPSIKFSRTVANKGTLIHNSLKKFYYANSYGFYCHCDEVILCLLQLLKSKHSGLANNLYLNSCITRCFFFNSTNLLN